MKFLCGNCKAKYQIADEKVEGRTLRMICRECGKEIIIQGNPHASLRPAARDSRSFSAPPGGGGSVLADDFRRQLADRSVDSRPAPAIDEWHVAINDIPVGPMRRAELARKIELGAVTTDSLAWREGLDDWMPARQIPELALLFAPPPAASAASMIDPRYARRSQAPRLSGPVRTGVRSAAAPIGGRMVAEQPFDDYLPPPPPADFGDRAVASPLGRAAVAPPTVSRQMWSMAGPLFAAICAGALLIMGGAWVGVKYLSTPPVTREITIEKVTEAAPAADQNGMSGAVSLDQQDIDGVVEEKSAAKTKTTTRTRTAQPATTEKKAPATQSGKQLSAAEKEMLARMGGGQSATALRQRDSASGSQSGAGGGGLKADQLSRVVSRGKRELQRCYEAALRANPSDQTIRLDIEIAVGISGKVTSVKTKGESLGQMSTCIERTIRMWSFPTAGDVTRTSFPVVFQPGA